jgi:hypothetical protein
MTQCNMSKVSINMFFCTLLLLRTRVRREGSCLVSRHVPEVMTQCNMCKVSNRREGVAHLVEGVYQWS